MTNGVSKFLKDESGVAAVIVGICATLLGGMWALSYDMGRAWNLETELQNAADAGALACATQLDGKAGARTRGISAATGLLTNRQTFANDGAGADVVITAGNVRFLVDLPTKTVATTDADSNYCEVTAAPRQVNFSLSRLVGGPGSANPQAVAIAEMSAARCRIPPIMICNPDESGPFDMTPGIGITLKDSSGPGLAPGNFGLLALPNFPSFILSANQIRDAWARVRPLAPCFAGEIQTKPGQTTAIRQGLNMRFDVYPQGTHQVPAGEPPVKSNPNYVPSVNSVKGLEKVGAQCSDVPAGWNNPTTPYAGTTPGVPPYDTMGFPRDACAYGFDCDVNAGGSHFGDGVWDSTGYMIRNHPTVGAGIAAVPDLNGNGTRSRYETYLWEIANNLSQNMPIEIAAPICNTVAPLVPTIPDRRVITAAVLNCSGISGTAIVQPIAWVDLFITEPMGFYDGNNDLYAEVIRDADVGGGKGVTRYVLQLVE